jgi:acyl-coenzyme A synthetase/AMP-(fatty) acid ligase
MPSGVEARIVNGQLEIQGPGVYKTGWFATGDLADQDSEGYYRIIGRIADRINVRGYKIDPLSVENQLYNTLPDLSQVAVFGQDHLMCIYTGSVTEQQVRQAIINIDQHCSPRMVKQVETIPVNPANKVSRSMLLEMYK